jgi:hypothetical protein
LNKKVVKMMLPREMNKFQHPSAPSMEREAATLAAANCLALKELFWWT